jgi:selT/selW/selH-like putative selenoprotein
LAADIKKQFGIEPTLTKGSNGIFDVKIDGEMLFSKYAVGRFPEHTEVLEPLGERLKK